jgi:hypothetical protein
MAGGNLDTTATIALFGAIVGIAGLAWVRLKPRHQIIDDYCDGDCRTAALAGEAAARRIVSEAGGCQAGSGLTHTQTPTVSHVLSRGREAFK